MASAQYLINMIVEEYYPLFDRTLSLNTPIFKFFNKKYPEDFRQFGSIYKLCDEQRFFPKNYHDKQGCQLLPISLEAQSVSTGDVVTIYPCSLLASFIHYYVDHIGEEVVDEMHINSLGLLGHERIYPKGWINLKFRELIKQNSLMTQGELAAFLLENIGGSYFYLNYQGSYNTLSENRMWFRTRHVFDWDVSMHRQRWDSIEGYHNRFRQ